MYHNTDRNITLFIVKDSGDEIEGFLRVLAGKLNVNTPPLTAGSGVMVTFKTSTSPSPVWDTKRAKIKNHSEAGQDFQGVSLKSRSWQNKCLPWVPCKQ
jgi:hypothetical protein